MSSPTPSNLAFPTLIQSPPSYAIPFDRRTAATPASALIDHPASARLKAKVEAKTHPPDEFSLSPKVSSEKNAQTEQPLENKENKVGFLGYLFPVLTMIGTPLMFGAMLLGLRSQKIGGITGLKRLFTKTTRMVLPKADEAGVVKKTGRWFNFGILDKLTATLMKNPTLKRISQNEAHLKKMYNTGKVMLALGIIPKSIIGLRFGLNAQQPAILLSKVMEILLFPLIMIESRIATAFNAFVGAFFTVGFANDMDNRPFKPDGEPEPKRVYDMTRFKSVFKKDSALKASHRIGIFVDEMGRMVKFAAVDHLVALRRVTDNIKKARNHEENDLFSLNPNDAAPKSSLALFVTYLATIPNMAATILPDSHMLKRPIDIASKILSGISGMLSEMSFMIFSSGGRNIFERLPAVGSFMEICGTILGYTQNPVTDAFAIGLQQFAAGVNSVFYAHRSHTNNTPDSQ